MVLLSGFSLVQFVGFVSKRFVNEIIMIIIKHLKKLDYERFDHQAQLSV